MADWFTDLSELLGDIAATTYTLTVGDGRLLVVPQGARLLACDLPSADGDAGNLFWHSRVLHDPAMTRKCLDAAGGGLGGDRLWIAPEVAHMWTDLQRARRDPFGTYIVPSAMDPADYRVVDQSDTHVALATQIKLIDHRVDKPITLAVDRRFDVIDAPTGLPAGLKVASFAIRNDLNVVDGNEGAVAGSWDLLQVPPGGTMIYPTTSLVENPRCYFDPFDDQHVCSTERCVRINIDGKKQFKLGLPPAKVTGRAGYYRRRGRDTALIVRILTVLPGEPYVDLPRDTDERFGGDAIQVYNDDSGDSFGELEYHDAAIVVGRTSPRRISTSVTHVLAGPDDAVKLAGQMLLGVAIEPFE